MSDEYGVLDQGTVIDEQYIIEGILGLGGMSNVYFARSARDDKPYAIKELRKTEKISGHILQQNFATEVRILTKLNHEHLPKIVKIIEEDDSFMIIMEYIEGHTLKSLLDKGETCAQTDVIKWGIQLCEILEYLHSRKPAVIYRDIKPANIMLMPDKNIKLIDFGTSREYKKGAKGDTECLGTKGYAAPEQYGDEQTDERTDIYNLGATMYHLVTGKSPTKPPYEIRPIRYWDESLSSGLETIISKCTKNDPAERYQKAADLRRDLENYKELETEALEKKKTPFRLFVAACFLSGLAFAGGAIAEISTRNGISFYDSGSIKPPAATETQQTQL